MKNTGQELQLPPGGIGLSNCAVLVTACPESHQSGEWVRADTD